MVASVRQLRRRIRSVENTAKITNAMSMIAASKMRRAQEEALTSRPYSDDLNSLLADLAAQPQEDEDNIHPLLVSREIRRIEVVLITPDRGLTGGLNSNINRAAGQFISEYGDNARVIAVGRKGRDFMIRYNRNVRAVFIAYAKFVNTTLQQAVIEQLLPVQPAELRPQDQVGYIYEPDPADVLSQLLPRYVEMQIYHALLEGIASEQSARMVAMRSATDNANAMVEDLTLVMNKARQESITTELLDIIGGAAAVEA
jgi:F-type H+-transporting ATPase subunit gamma